MSIRHIATVSRREVREMLGDWRILLPVGLLAFVLPLLIANATVYVINFVQDERLADALVPFALLLVGFIPASFSIVTALESFVGERERNTLEALLALPLSDRALYISKITSALLTPLLSSYSSMLVFSFLMYTFANRLYLNGMSPDRLLLVFLIVGLLSVTMVAAAVVISSHASSIRAANLMASFVLLPGAVVVQIASFQMIANRWDILWLVVLLLAAAAFLLLRAGLTSFNREEILSRAHQLVNIPPLSQRLQIWLSRSPQPASASTAAAPPVLRITRHRIIAPLQAVLTIARRELRETLTDWRVLIPVFVLTFVVPLVLISLVDYGLAFVDDTRQLGRVVPFGILLVGFIPASFSIITALESFVGERERNSLEALLAMPVSDNELYASKIISSLVVPMLTGYTAMLLFAGLLIQFYPELYFVRMDLTYLVQLLLMISVMSLVMVAGAVIISSHTSSIRAANLLASFILIPVTSLVALQLPLFIANRWELVWLMMEGLLVAAIALLRTGAMTFNREEILSRENERVSLQGTLAAFSAFFREHHAAGVPLAAYQGAAFSLRRFYRRELPALLAELRPALLLALLAALSGLATGWYYGTHFTFPGLNTILAQVGTAPTPGLGLALAVFANNIRVSLISNVFSLLAFGIFAFLVPAVAFMQVGVISGALWLRGGDPLLFVLAYVLPHGIIELPAFILSAALGIRLGVSVLSPPKGFTVGQHMLWALAAFAKVWLLVLLPLVLVAALVEGFVTPLVVQALYGG